MTEVWKPVTGFAGLYEVSDLGRVRAPIKLDAIGRMYSARELKLCKDRKGYAVVHLYKNRKRKPVWVACLVAEVFIGPRPAGMQVCHCDGDKTNNCVSNLRYDTVKSNHADKRQHGTHREGSKINFAKLDEARVKAIKALLPTNTHTAIAKQYGVSRPTISLIAEGKTWAHV